MLCRVFIVMSCVHYVVLCAGLFCCCFLCCVVCCVVCEDRKTFTHTHSHTSKNTDMHRHTYRRTGTHTDRHKTGTDRQPPQAFLEDGERERERELNVHHMIYLLIVFFNLLDDFDCVLQTLKWKIEDG
jgi:hypothetical protein